MASRLLALRINDVVIRKEYWGQRMLARGYFACTTGNVKDEIIKRYIEEHIERDDSFKVRDDLES